MSLTKDEREAAIEKMLAVRCVYLRSPHDNMADILDAVLPLIERAVLLRAAEVCRQQAQDFLDPKYAVGQPLSSFAERFACNECKRALAALADEVRT